MIPREILKKIRQIRLRTNRLVTETLAGFSLQPSQESPAGLRAPWKTEMTEKAPSP